MDPLFVTGSVVAVTTRCISFANEIFTAWNHYREVPQSIVDLGDEIQIVHASLLQLQRVLRREKTPITADLEDVFGIAVRGCHATLICLEEEFRAMQGRTDWRSRIEVLWKDDIMTRFLGQLERKKSSIMLLMQCFDLESSYEVRELLRRSRPELQRSRADLSCLVISYPQLAAPLIETLDRSTIASIAGSKDSVLSTTEFAFDVELINTRVYREIIQRRVEHEDLGSHTNGSSNTLQAETHDYEIQGVSLTRHMENPTVKPVPTHPGRKSIRSVHLENSTEMISREKDQDRSKGPRKLSKWLEREREPSSEDKGLIQKRSQKLIVNRSTRPTPDPIDAEPLKQLYCEPLNNEAQNSELQSHGSIRHIQPFTDIYFKEKSWDPKAYNVSAATLPDLDGSQSLDTAAPSTGNESLDSEYERLWAQFQHTGFQSTNQSFELHDRSEQSSLRYSDQLSSPPTKGRSVKSRRSQRPAPNWAKQLVDSFVSLQMER